MAYELFDKRTTRSRPRVRFGLNGQMYFSVGAVAVFKDAPAVELLLDREAKRFAVRPVAAQTPDSYPLRRGKEGNARIAALHFCEALSVVRSITIPLRWEPDIGALSGSVPHVDGRA
jgi:hypothetical protein